MLRKKRIEKIRYYGQSNEKAYCKSMTCYHPINLCAFNCSIKINFSSLSLHLSIAKANTFEWVTLNDQVKRKRDSVKCLEFTRRMFSLIVDRLWSTILLILLLWLYRINFNRCCSFLMIIMACRTVCPFNRSSHSMLSIFTAPSLSILVCIGALGRKSNEFSGPAHFISNFYEFISNFNDLKLYMPHNN